MVLPVRALGLTLLVMTGLGARKGPGKRAQEETTHPPSAPGEKRLTPEPVIPLPTILLAQVAPRILSHPPEETRVVPGALGLPVVHVVPEALEEIGILEVTTDTKKIGEETAPHLGKGAVVTVTAQSTIVTDTVITVPAP